MIVSVNLCFTKKLTLPSHIINKNSKILIDGNTRVCRLFNPLSLYHPSTSVVPLMQVSHDGYWRILNWNVLWDLLLGSWGWLEVVVGEFVVGFPPNAPSGAGVENSSNMKAETVSERLLLQFLFTQLSWYLVWVWIVCFTPNFGHSYTIVI